MTSDDPVDQILAVVTAQVAASEDALPQALCDFCARDLPKTGVAIVLQSVAGLDRLIAATPGLGEDLEHVQFELGEGPGVDASQQDGPMLQSDLAAGSGRWPLFTPAAIAAGGRAAFAFPLQVGGIRLA